ncbi:MAG TPA: hypothetical protein VMC83_33440 [Streptosporangiaceae bacterium]|nr:hypothetical protein [Streptosporangiaceae bacterium]
MTLAVAGASAALLAILVVALGLSLGGAPAAQPPGHSPAALAANSGAASGEASGAAASSAASKAAVAGSGTRRGTPAPQHSPAAKPAPAQATVHHRHHHHHTAAPQAQVTAAQAQPRPYLVYDSVNPGAIPGDPVVATYADGPHPDSASSVANFSHVLWVDIDASDPHADALDIEPGCATPSEAVGWVSARLNADPHGVAILYTMISQWQTVRDDVSSLPGWMQSRIRWWIADPTGSPHVVPGSQATQWYWGQNYDISTALPGF